MNLAFDKAWVDIAHKKALYDEAQKKRNVQKYFKPGETFNLECISLEYAKSDRSECKKCASKIGKGEIRISHTLYYDPDRKHVNKRWYHVGCFSVPEKFIGITIKEFEGIEDIKSEDYKSLVKSLKIEEGDGTLHPPKKIERKKHKEVEKFED